MSSISCDCCDNLEKLGISDCSVINVPVGNHSEENVAEFAVKLCGVIKINEKCHRYPSVKHTKMNIMFQEMVEILSKNLSDYEENILSFWILDMFIEGLKTAQDYGMNHKHQKITLIWIAFIFNYMQENNVSREEMFKYLFSLILPFPHFEQVGEYDEDEKTIYETNKLDPWTIPLPPDDNESLKSTASLSDDTENLVEGESFIMKDVNSTKINIDHMKIILEILYRIFSRFWVFKALQIMFRETPLVNIVNLPFTLCTPKTILQQETLTSVKSGRSQKKQQEDEEVDVASYKNDFILPLQLADGAQTYVRQLFNIPSKETIPASTKKSKK